MNSLKNLRDRIDSEIESTARIMLPFSVQTHISNTWHLGWKDDTTRVICIDLSAESDECALISDLKPFEISQRQSELSVFFKHLLISQLLLSL